MGSSASSSSRKRSFGRLPPSIHENCDEFMFIAHQGSSDGDDDDDDGTVVTIATWDGRSVATATTSRSDGSSGTSTHYQAAHNTAGAGAGRPCKRRRQRNATAVLSMLSLLSAALVLATTSSTSYSLRGTKPSLFRLQSMRRTARKLLELTPEHIDQYPFTGLADVAHPFGRGAATDTGLYWQIPRSGGTTLKTILGTCLNKVQASRVARDHCDLTDDNLHLCQTTFGRYVNADPSDDPGIERSHRLDLIGSGLADVLVSSRILHVSELFDEEHHHGRAFTVLRHPVERTASTFHYLQNAEWERQYSPELKTMSLPDYAQLESTANDWMVRWLTGKHAEVLTRSDLEFAKELLRRKFLILLTDEMKTSVTRLASYMGWTVTDDMMGCIEQHSSKSGGANQSSNGGAARPPLEAGSADYEALLNINRLDVELYEYAQELFVGQWAAIQDRAKEHGKSHPPPAASSAGDETATTSTKKGLFGFLRNDKPPTNQDQQDQADEAPTETSAAETSAETSTPEAIENTETTAVVQQHGLVVNTKDGDDDEFSLAGVGSATPGSTVAEAARNLEQRAGSSSAPAAAGTEKAAVPDQTPQGDEQHGLVSRQTQQVAADTSAVPSNTWKHSVVHTQEMDMAQQMRRKAQLVLGQHKRRLSPEEAPPAR